MNNDPLELRQISDAVQATAPRVDLYAGIHKAMRALMSDTLLAVGRMDCHDDLELAEGTQRIMQMLDFCRSHLRHENDFVHPALEARAPGASERITHEHAGHEGEIDALARQATALLNTEPTRRAARTEALYRALGLFIAHNFEHMNVEETAHNAVLWARYTDDELVQIHGALLASIPPDEMMFALRWMVPCMNPAERADLLADMRLHAPAPAFAAALDVVRPHLDDRGWSKLCAALDMAPA